MPNNKKYPVKPKKKLDEFSYHEACDRVYLVTEIVDSSLNQHQVFKEHKSLRSSINKIIDELSELYQVIGNLEYMKSLESETTETENNTEK